MILAGAILFAPAALEAKKKKTPPKPATYDYFLLTLSWAPDFCAIPSNPHDPAECGVGKKVGFVVHGLWPQGETNQGPKCKADGTKVTPAIVTAMLPYMPTAKLMQHEWDNHGSCSGLSMTDYFAAIRTARDSVKLPPAFQAPATKAQMSEAQIEAAFASANPSFPATAFRATCTSGALQEARVCLTKNLAPRACGSSAGSCSLATMNVLPVK
jgi:ribonuclease T2